MTHFCGDGTSLLWDYVCSLNKQTSGFIEKHMLFISDALFHLEQRILTFLWRDDGKKDGVNNQNPHNKKKWGARGEGLAQRYHGGC